MSWKQIISPLPGHKVVVSLINLGLGYFDVSLTIKNTAINPRVNAFREDLAARIHKNIQGSNTCPNFLGIELRLLYIQILIRNFLVTKLIYSFDFKP